MFSHRIWVGFVTGCLAVHGTTGSEMDRSGTDSRSAERSLSTSSAGSSTGTSPPSAPVYGDVGPENDTDPEEDLYSGGRAV